MENEYNVGQDATTADQNVSYSSVETENLGSSENEVSRVERVLDFPTCLHPFHERVSTKIKQFNGKLE